MKNGLISNLLAGAMLVACGSSDVTIGTRAASSTSEPDASNGGDTAPVATPAPPAPCGADELCLDVVPIRPGTKPLAGRLVIFWHQLADNGYDPPPKIAYDVPFTGTETRIVIPRSAIALPDEVHFTCERACFDERTCPCISEPKVAIARVVVAIDENGNGAIDVQGNESTSEIAIGVGRVGISYSEVAYADPGGFSDLFPDGIGAGIQWHSVEPRADKPYWDAMRVVPPGTVFELEVCDTTERTDCNPSEHAPDYT